MIQICSKSKFKGFKLSFKLFASRQEGGVKPSMLTENNLKKKDKIKSFIEASR